MLHVPRGLGAVHVFLYVARTEQLDVLWSRAKTLRSLPTCCSSSLRLSGEIRSQACLSPPLLPSSSLLSVCLAPSIFTSLLQPPSLCFPLFFVFFNVSSIFSLHAAECKSSASARIPSPLLIASILLSLYLSLRSVFPPLCSYL